MYAVVFFPKCTAFFFFLILGIQAIASDVLIIGDSHTCGSFGKYLFEKYSQPEAKVTLYCAVSSAAQNWLEAKNPTGQQCQTKSTDHPQLQPCDPEGHIPKLASILSAHNTAKLIIALGTNSLLSPMADASYSKLAAAAAKSNTCEWIGPPHLNPAQSKGFPKGRIATLEKNLDSFYKSLAALQKNCILIDSRPATAEGTEGFETIDGVHRADAAADHWVKNLNDE